MDKNYRFAVKVYSKPNKAYLYVSVDGDMTDDPKYAYLYPTRKLAEKRISSHLAGAADFSNRVFWGDACLVLVEVIPVEHF